MSDPVVITLIIVVAVLFVLYLYREKLQSFFFEGGGMKTGMKTHKPAAPVQNTGPSGPGVVISGNQQKGSGHRINVARDAQVTENKQTGKDNQINVKPGEPQA